MQRHRQVRSLKILLDSKLTLLHITSGCFQKYQTPIFEKEVSVMKKFNVLIFSSVLLGFSFYGLFGNSYYVQLLMNLSMLFNFMRIALVTVLLMYVFVPSLRLYTTRAMLSVLGIFLLSVGVISVGFPSILGHFNMYILLGDSIVLIELGILSIVLSAELSAQRSRFMARCYCYIRALLFTTRPKLLTYNPPPILSKSLKTQPL